MNPPTCPHCGQPVTRALDVPYGWWEWDAGRGRYELKTASNGVDVSPWVHDACMHQLRHFHPQDREHAAPTAV